MHLTVALLLLLFLLFLWLLWPTTLTDAYAVCVISVKMVNSSVSSIPVDGLASGSQYQVHVESISLSGIANSKPSSFVTQSKSDHQRTVLIIVIVISTAVVFSAFVILVSCRYVAIAFTLLAPCGFPGL